MTATKVSRPIAGSWKLLTVTTSHPDLPHPKSALTVFAASPDGLRYKAETTWSDGRATVAEADFKLDGSWSPVTGSPLADSVSLHAIDERNYEAALRKSGVESGRNKIRISSDGQTMLTEWELIVPGGPTIHLKTIFERM
ncbi:MAG: hypothetical protein KGN84_05300 [Acidobacteriota bacterium]|nr:hypothetical protein [Acidobacteriota bacterium]